MADVKFKVYCLWDHEVSLWYVSESNVPGLVGEAPTVEAMDHLLRGRIPELLRLNMPELASDANREVPYELLTERHEKIRLAC